MFSTFYLAMVIILVALILRGLSFEYRRKIDDGRWQSLWRWSLTIGSLLIPFLLGTALGDLLYGLPIDSAHNYTGSFFGLLVPYGLYTGLTLTALSLFLGAAYLTLKTTGELHARVARLSGRLGWLAAAITFGWLTWSHVGLGVGFVPTRLTRWRSSRWSVPHGWPRPARRAGPSPLRRPRSGVWWRRCSSTSSRA
jgi:cytochrome d ubiquinol oxidase subunit II